MYDPNIVDKSGSIESLANELAARLQALDSEKEDGEYKETSETSQVSQLPAQPVKKSWLDKLVGKVKEALEVSNVDTKEGKDESSMMAFKDSEGQWVWFARYSNNFRDDDLTPEIISEGSHRQFVDAVDKGLAPYPELWLWHVKEWKIGRANWLAYDDAGFALAAGYFNKGCEQVAEWLSEQKEIAVSHGMPVKSIVRDPNDSTVIVQHRTSEISPLPVWAAANMITSLISSRRKSRDEEVDMIPQDKKEALKKMGLSDELLASVEAMNAEDAAKAVAEGVESKEKETAPEAAEAPAAETTPADAPVGEPPVEETPEENEPEEKEAPVTKKEVADAFASVFSPFVDRMEALENSVKELQSALQKMGETVKEQDVLKGSPVASLAAMFAESATRSKETQVLSDDPLLNLKPKENTPVPVGTGIPFIDSMLASGKK